jgi:uncharacterized membrane protein YphA (DoxX/SURF4 family)
MSSIQEIYHEAKADKWFKKFAVFCRIVLAASFIPTGFVKIMGERFAAGLPSNNPLGHYFDALQQTGYYYTFLGIAQIIIAILLLIPRTSLLGALMYFPIIINICVLTYATRFEGTRLVTMMVLACLFLLIWDFDRLKHILPFKHHKTESHVIKKPLGIRLRLIFFGCCFAVLAIIIIGTFYLFEIGRLTRKRYAEINVRKVKTQGLAKHSAIVFIMKVDRLIVVWQLLIRRKIFAEYKGNRLALVLFVAYND